MTSKKLAKLGWAGRIRIFVREQVQARELRVRGNVKKQRFAFNSDLKRDGKGIRLVDFLNPPALQREGNFL